MRLTWPLPALLSWAAAWIVFAGMRTCDVSVAIGFALAAVLGVALALRATTPWRRIFVAGGFPLSFAAAGLAGALPAWAWLAPLGLLLLLYPLRAWRDAPLFPTPRGALAGLESRVCLDAGARVLDAGCGLGAGLIELRRRFPQATLEGIEWSGPLRLGCALRCRFARVRRGDLWAADWSSCALVYLFQRPESMARAAEKAAKELAPGAWLASLEFEAATLVPEHVLEGADGRRVWLYRAPLRRR